MSENQEPNSCPLKENCKVVDKWCGTGALKKARGHCFVKDGATPQKALEQAQQIIKDE